MKIRLDAENEQFVTKLMQFLVKHGVTLTPEQIVNSLLKIFVHANRYSWESIFMTMQEETWRQLECSLRLLYVILDMNKFWLGDDYWKKLVSKLRRCFQ